MIARVWRGITSIHNADPYLTYLNQVILPGYQTAKGNQGVFVFREVQGELVYFLLLSFWSSHDDLARFIGPHLEIARQTPEEQNFLVASESVVSHYEVFKPVLPDPNPLPDPEQK